MNINEWWSELFVDNFFLNKIRQYKKHVYINKDFC